MAPSLIPIYLFIIWIVWRSWAEHIRSEREYGNHTKALWRELDKMTKGLNRSVPPKIGRMSEKEIAQRDDKRPLRLDKVILIQTEDRKPFRVHMIQPEDRIPFTYPKDAAKTDLAYKSSLANPPDTQSFTRPDCGRQRE